MLHERNLLLWLQQCEDEEVHFLFVCNLRLYMYTYCVVCLTLLAKTVFGGHLQEVQSKRTETSSLYTSSAYSLFHNTLMSCAQLKQTLPTYLKRALVTKHSKPRHMIRRFAVSILKLLLYNLLSARQGPPENRKDI